MKPLQRFYGVMVSTQDSESCDPSSNLGRTLTFREKCLNILFSHVFLEWQSLMFLDLNVL